MKRVKVDPTTYVVKAIWDSTALVLKVPAWSSDEALEKAWKRVRKLEGGIMCQEIKLVRTS